MSGLLSLNDVQGYAVIQCNQTQDQVNSLNLTVAYSSDTEPDARTICLWADQGTPEPAYPLTSSRGATTACDVYITADNAVTGVDCLKLESVVAPTQLGSIWLNDADNHVYHGAVDLEATGTGDVVGPASATDNGIAVYDGTTGKLLKSSAVTVDVANDGISADYLDLSGSAYANYALGLPSSVGSSNTLVQIGPSRFINLSTNATTSVSIGLGAGGNQGGNGNYGYGYEVFYNLLAAGVDNTAAGAQAMRSATTAKRCAAYGRSALYGLTTGEDNIGIGYEAGSAYTTESGNICIDHDGVAADAGVIRIGTAQTKNFQQGIVGITTGVNDAIPVVIDSNNQLGTVSSSIKYKENVKDLTNSDVIYKLRPVEFNYKEHTDKSKTNIGLIAEEVEEIDRDLCIYHPNKETGEKELLTVDYNRLPILLLKEVQGLQEKYNQLLVQNMSLANEVMKIKTSLKL